MHQALKYLYKAYDIYIYTYTYTHIYMGKWLVLSGL